MRMMRAALACVVVAACGGGPLDLPDAPVDRPDTRPVPDATPARYTAGDPIVVGADPGNDEDPAVLVARDGSLYVAWFSEAAGFDIVIRRSTDGLTWSAPVHVSTGAPHDFGPALYQDAAGYVHAVWFRWETGAPPGHLIHNRSTAPDDGLTWSQAAESDATGIGAWDDWVPAIAADASGAMVIAFARNTCPPPNECYGIYTTRSTDGAAWSAPAPVIEATATEEHHLPSLALAGNALYLAWDPFDRDASSPFEGLTSGSYIATMRDTGAGFTDRVDVTTRADDTIGVFPWLLVDATDPVLVWLSATAAGTQTVAQAFTAPVPPPRTPLPELAGYSAKLVPTPTPGVYLGAWVSGPDGERDVTVQLIGPF